MFVIGRAIHEEIQIGNSVTIKVLRIADKYVTLGIDAARAVPLPRNKATDLAGARAEAGCDLSVLVVDGTPIHICLIQKALTAYGVEHTRIAGNGMEALRLLGLEEGGSEQILAYDFILMDLRLPDMPGLELLRRIRSARTLRTVPVVIVSYENADTEVSRFLQAGANAFVPKPETQEGFHQTIFRIADFWSHTCRVSGGGARREQEQLVC